MKKKRTATVTCTAASRVERSKRRFSLAGHMKVTGANLDNGMLHVDLVHEVAEAAKPRKIEIAYSPCSRRSRSRRRLLNNQRLLTGRPQLGAFSF